MADYQKEETKKCECGAEIKTVRSGGKYIAVDVRPTIVNVVQYQFGRRVYSPVSGFQDHRWTCSLKKKSRRE